MQRQKKHIADQANKAMFALLKKIRTFGLPLDLQLELFDKMIKPILMYAAEIWGFGNCDVIERVHLGFLKYILKLKKINTVPHDIWRTRNFPNIARNSTSSINILVQNNYRLQYGSFRNTEIINVCLFANLLHAPKQKIEFVMVKEC